jgi:zinc transporter ZupT
VTSENPAADLEDYINMAEDIHLEDYINMAEDIQARKQVHFHTEGSHCDHGVEGECNHEDNYGNVSQKEKHGDGDDEVEASKMMSLSIDTAVAIALHNFPEGLATFVAAHCINKRLTFDQMH